MSSSQSAAVLDFWFGEAAKSKWFVKEEAFDTEIRTKFGALHAAAAAGELDSWAASPDGTLALIITLDQFPRNMFRGKPEAFGTDAKALEVAKAAVAAGTDMEVPADRRMFMYLPYEHSENAADQELSVKLFTERLGNAYLVTYAVKHKEIIDRFGRFPHRNEILGRASTEEEIEFLKTPGSSF